MPRKGPAQRRELTPDPIYRSLLVTQIVNKVMLHGKRSVAEKIVYDALTVVGDKTGGDPIAALTSPILPFTAITPAFLLENTLSRNGLCSYCPSRSLSQPHP